MGDLEEFEVKMLRRDHEIDAYNDWYHTIESEIKESTFETLLSWIAYNEYCPRCGDYKRATKTSTDHEYYQYECGHYSFRWDNAWTGEIGGWIPKATHNHGFGTPCHTRCPRWGFC